MTSETMVTCLLKGKNRGDHFNQPELGIYTTGEKERKKVQSRIFGRPL
jgi:hypothetical protein